MLRGTSGRTRIDVRGSLTHRKAARGFAFAAISAFLIASWSAFSQASPSAGLDAQTQGPAIIAHLSAAIQFYRSVNQPIQRAGEPNDVIYREQAISQASQIAGLAFQSARAEAALVQGGAQGGAGTSSDMEQRIQATEASVEKRMKDLQSSLEVVNRKLEAATPRTEKGLEAEKQQIQAALDLAEAMQAALHRITAVSGASGSTGLLADIERLQRSAPELQSNNKTSFPQITTIESALSAGVTTQGSVLFQLLGTQRSIGSLIDDNQQLRQRALDVRAPMVAIVRGLIQQGQQLSEQAAASVSAAPAVAGKKAPAGAQTAPATPAGPAPEDLRTITARFRSISSATVPLSQELILLDQSRANLIAWQTSVQREYNTLLHALLLRVLVIAIALGVIFGAGELWTRGTNKYIRELRRRRQLLIVRRVVVGFLSAIVILFGFVTRFDSLATFAGFITAGIAVGLQTILLSVAAYFFIIGRYGIKVGDRISIAAVTGEVIEVGLVRFYLMELAGTGNHLNPTGRVAVFSNAVLFQAGTPLYKQLPGTNYAWHELTVKLAEGARYESVADAVMKRVCAVYEEYRAKIEHEHKTVQGWMQTSIETPMVESRLQFADGGLQLWARFPVEMRNAPETDEKISRSIVKLMASDTEVRAALAGSPLIQPSVHG